jgi:Uma2 family endonuclease
MPSRLARAPTDPAAFVAWESRRALRYGLMGGEVRLMAGGNRAHDLIAVNILTALLRTLRGGGCDVHGSNLKVVSPVGMVTYPDLFVRCGPLPDEALACDDPVAIVEVLSLSTRSEDLVRKRWGYQAFPDLRHLVYVDVGTSRLRWRREPRMGWWSVFLRRLNDRLKLEASDASSGLPTFTREQRLPRARERYRLCLMQSNAVPYWVTRSATRRSGARLDTFAHRFYPHGSVDVRPVSA